jgi:hypothetical protein
MICIPIFIALCFNLFLFSIQLTFGKDIFSLQYFMLQAAVLDCLLAWVCIVYGNLTQFRLFSGVFQPLSCIRCYKCKNCQKDF